MDRAEQHRLDNLIEAGLMRPTDKSKANKDLGGGLLKRA